MASGQVPATSPRRSLSHQSGIRPAAQSALVRWPSLLWKHGLTVLCYHRIADAGDPATGGFPANISASPQGFLQQLEIVTRHYRPVSVAEVARWLRSEAELPPRALLITFDDGYRDIATTAWPLLKSHGVPAIVFLSTEHIGSKRPYLCDWVHHCFASSTLARATVPLLGAVNIENATQRRAAAERWMECAKRLPHAACASLRDELANSLGLFADSEALTSLCLDWNEVRSLAEEGLEFGAHTRTHAILSRLGDAEIEQEVSGSFDDLHERLGAKPLAFAYPNGARGDFSERDEAAVRNAGFALAFSTCGGPQLLAGVRRHPYRIRRIVVTARDDLARFAAKLAGGSWVYPLKR